jgi:hypothetical protein
MKDEISTYVHMWHEAHQERYVVSNFTNNKITI